MLCNKIKNALSTSKLGETEWHYLRFVSRSIRNVREEVIAYLTAFLSSEREKGDCSAWSPHRWCLRRCIFAGWERQCLPLIKNKSFHKRSILRPNGFLPLQEAHFPPIIKASIRGSEDGAENIPAAPAFRPVSGISPKCWGKYFNREISHHLYFSRFDCPVFGVSWLIIFV